MSRRYITELSDGQIESLPDGELRDLIRGVDLPLEENGQVLQRLDQLDHDTLVRLVYHIRRQYQNARQNTGE